MTIFDDLLASGKFTSDMIVSWTHQINKPIQVTFNTNLTEEQSEIYRTLLLNYLDPERSARKADFEASKTEMILQFASVITDLNTYIDYPAPVTQADFNSKVWQFTKLSARVLRFSLRLLRYLVFG